MNCEKLYNKIENSTALSFVSNSKIKNKLQKVNFNTNVINKKSKSQISMMAKKVVFLE